MKVAVTIWAGRISPVFDVCREIRVLAIRRGQVVESVDESVDPADPDRKIQRLLALGVETLICGAISAALERELQAHGVKVVGFVAGEVDRVVGAFLAGQLPTPALEMPGGRGRRRRFRGGGGGVGCGGRRRPNRQKP